MRNSKQTCLRTICIVLSMLCASFGVFSQEGIDISYIYGSILVHTPKVKPITGNPIKGFSVSYTLKNKSGEHWRNYYNYANYGFNYKFKSFNNPDIIGNSHALTSFIQLSFLKKAPVFDIGFKGAAGLAYLTKTHDEFTNPENTAISTHLNIAGEIQFYSKLRFHPIFFEYSYGLNHFSNGLLNTPNLGINSLNHHYTFGWEFEKPAPKNKPPKESRSPFIKNEFWVYASAGANKVKEYDQYFLFLAASLNYSKQITTINKLGFGIDFINDEALNKYAVTHLNFNEESDLSFRFGPNIQGEFMFGKLSFLGAYGFFFGDTTNYISRAYYKVGAKYYAKNIIGIAMIRAVPLFKAQVLEFGIGYRFPRIKN
ncbi:acyloxyacyl hydrolase [Prolixibacteraceae bacterium Z1-6]|uniref:Acyloxyacyl hydrolase n=1 Tax=Draconibacterium aestuarii TaxID=2998507 RepID=A0A9X3F8D2_9BACT|nr:acyloxyacyl hydrolase [Prolixibacteraceae bacterium Z1-6]